MFISHKADYSCAEWQDYTLILPTVSVGNVGQLTADLLISTLMPSRVGYLYTDCIVPTVGNNPFAQFGSQDMFEMTTAAEVFESKEHKLIIIQQRAPFVKGKGLKFVNEIMKWIESCHFKQVFILTSVFAHERRDTQLVGQQTRYLLTPKAETTIGTFLRDASKWILLEKRPSDVFTSTMESDIFIPGSGITKTIFEKCRDAGLAAAVLLIFCAEGDNVIESLQLASYINSYFQWISSEKNSDKTGASWKIPSSWKLQFGSHFNQMLY